MNKTNNLFTKMQIKTSFFNKHEKSCVILVITIITFQQQNKSAFLPKCKQKDEHSVAGISEHDSVQKGEGDDRKNGRIHLKKLM